MTDKLTYEEAVEDEESRERVAAIIDLLESQGYSSIEYTLPVIGAVVTGLLVASYEAEHLFYGSEHWIKALREEIKRHYLAQ